MAWDRFCVALSLVCGCAEEEVEDEVEARSGPAPTHFVYVDENGQFTPDSLTISDGDHVVWLLHDRYDSVIRIDPGDFSDVCNARGPYVHDDPDELTGPMPVAAGGIFALNPGDKPGLVVVDEGDADDPMDPCGQADDRGSVGTQHLCASGPEGAVMDTTWADPSTAGVFIRLTWEEVNPEEGVYDFTILQSEVEKAVDNGKLFSLAIEAGKGGTPDWIFTTGIVDTGGGPQYFIRPFGGGGVDRVHLQDHADHPDDPYDCGLYMDLGAPYDDDYQAHYFAMLSEVADLLKSRADWYRALAYIKPSGANMFTAENRLPKGCDGDCPICNSEAWSDAGYRPRHLYDFYEAQLIHLAAEFPGKTMSYQLIHNGFLRINGAGGYVDRNGNLTAGTEEIDSTEQTQEIIDRGQADHGLLFAVQHNGLQPTPYDPCPDAPGCPNDMVRIEGEEGQYIGYQTQNITDIENIAELDSALSNATDNTAAAMIEIYEERLWEAQQTADGVLDEDGSGLTLAEWDDLLRQRRHQVMALYGHTFTNTGASDKTIYYIHGSKCDPAAPHYGSITVEP